MGAVAVARQGWGERLRGLAMMLVLATAAACAPRKPPPAPPPPPPVEAPKPEVLPPAPEARHQVAVLVPLSGPNAAVGQSLANAAVLALADTGSKVVRISSYDTAPGAGAAASRALADGATLILGPLFASDVALVRAPAAARQVPVLSFSNDAGVAGGNVYVLGFQPAQSIARSVAYARSRGSERFAALVPHGTYGERAAVAFTRAVQASGGRVVGVTSFTRDRAQLPAAARRVAGYDARLKAGSAGQPAPLGFDTLLIADSGPTVAAFVVPLAKFGVAPPQVQFIGTELWEADPGLARIPSLSGALFATVPDARYRTFEARYRARFGANPSRLASLAYDACLLAIGMAAQWPMGAPFPADRLNDPKGFSGVDGIFRFTGNVAERGMEVQRVTPGGFVTAAPAPTGF